MVGSSSVRGILGDVMGRDLERKGYAVERFGVSSAGLARPDFRDMQALVANLSIAPDTAVVFVYLGVNDGQSIWLRPGDREHPDEPWLRWNDPRWPSVYRKRAQQLYESMCKRGAQRVIVILPVQVVKPSLERRLRRIRTLQREAAERVSCALALSTTGDDETFTVKGEPTRQRDGFHLTRVGAELVWQRVKSQARRKLLAPGRWVIE